MARTISSRSELKTGDKVYLFTTDFPAEVTDVSGYIGTVEVRDIKSGNTHFIYTNRLLKAAPYEVGQKYIDADSGTFTFVADTDADAWENDNGSLRDFDYPSRPLRKVTYGPELDD